MPKTCIKKNEDKIQKNLFDFNCCHFHIKFFSNNQLAIKIIWGMLVGTVPNNIPAAKPIIPNKNI
jgi:hypothetical protein